MAISNLNLNVTANTARALADFGKFSRSLDNKFLISGLKLDVVRNALSQINKDFQRAIGEQGLASASSLRAAQNQAALLTQTFKGFASDSALAISQNIGTALNKVAVTAGGTMKDVQKTLAATPFISTKLSEDLRTNLAKGIMAFQRDMRRGGLGENFGGMAQQFLMGQATGMQMVNSGDAAGAFLGGEIIKRVGGEGLIYSPERRSEILNQIVNDPEIQQKLREMAVRASGYKIILEDLNTKLFNPETGVFGALRKVVDAAGTPTTMFEQVERLTKQVFGESGMFAMLIKAIRDVFGSGDPMRPFIDAIQFMTKVFKNISDYFNTTAFRNVLGQVKNIVDRVSEVFTGIYKQITGGGFSAEEITRSIGSIGESIRGYIKQFGEAIRNKDVSKESGFAGDIMGTLVEEVGRTAIVLIKEMFLTLVDKVPEIVTGILPALNKGINSVLTEAFGATGAALIKFIAGFIPGPIGMIARASAVGDITGGGGSMGSLLAMGAAAAITPGSVMAARGFAGRGMAATRQQLGGFALPFRYGYGMARGYSFPLNGRLGQTQYGSPIGPGPFDPGRGGGGGYRFPTDPMMGPSSPYGQITSRTSALAGTVGYDIPSSPLFRSRFGRITPETSMFRPYVLSPSDPRRITAGTTMFGPRLGRQQYISPIGPLPHGSAEPWTARSPEEYGIYDPYLQSGLMSRERISRTDAMAGRPYRAGYPQELQDRFNRRYGARGSMARFNRGLGQIGRGIHGVGMGGGYMMAGSLAAEVAGRAVGGAGGEILSGLGQGAAVGGQIGMFLGPKGALAGAAIGALIGGIAPMMDEGVRKGVTTFLSGMANTVKSLGSGIVTGVTDLGNGLLTALGSLPRMASGVMQSIYNSLPGPVKAGMGFLNSAWSGVTGFVSRLNIPSPFYAGKDYAGPAMALEARMSGRKPMVVNDGEFVIPKDGFGTLAGIVGENLRANNVSIGGSNGPVSINFNLSLTTHAITANADDLANELREPVYQIIREGWTEAINATRVQRTRVN